MMPLKFQFHSMVLNVDALSSGLSSPGAFCEGGSRPGGGVTTPGSEIVERPYFCCVKKNEGPNEPPPFGFHGHLLTVSNACQFLF